MRAIRLKTRKYIHQIYQSCLILFGLFTSTFSYGDDTVKPYAPTIKDKDYYLTTRSTLQRLCSEFDQRPMETFVSIYKLTPNDYDTATILYTGSKLYEDKIPYFKERPNYIPNWDWIYETEDGRRCRSLDNESKDKVPVKLVYEKTKRAVLDDPIDMRKFLNPATDNIMENGRRYDHIFNPALQPVPPGVDFLVDGTDSQGHRIIYDYEEDITKQRRLAFATFIENDSIEFLEKFIFVIGQSSGSNTLDNHGTALARFLKGDALRRPSKEDIARQPNWFTAYNNILPVMCRRIQEGNTPQKLCLEMGIE